MTRREIITLIAECASFLVVVIIFYVIIFSL